MSGYGDNDNSEYIEGNRGDRNYIDSNPTRGEHAGSGGMMDKLKGAMGMGGNKDRSDYDSSNTDSYGSGNTRDKYSSDNTNTDSYGSGNTRTGRDTSDTYGSTGRDTSDTYGSTGRDTSDTYGSSGRGNTDTYGSNTTSGIGSDTYGSTGNTTSSYGVGNVDSSFTAQPIGSTKGGDAFANKAYDGQRTVDDFTSGTGTGASNLTSRTGADSYGQGNTNTYGSGRDTTDSYGSSGRDTTDTYGSSGRDRDTSDTYGSSTTDTYGSSGDNYGEGRERKKEGMMDKMAGKMGMRTNADAYDQDRNTKNINPENY